MAPYFIAIHIRSTVEIDGFMCSNDGTYRTFASACVFDSGGKWVIATAGHVVNLIKSLKRDDCLVSLKIIDFLGRDDVTPEAIPLQVSEEFVLGFDDAGIDFGFIDIPDNTVDLLRANGTTPITENHWRHRFDDDDYDMCYLAGVPAAAHSITSDDPTDTQYNACLALARLEHKFEVPEAIANDAPIWYGRMKISHLPFTDYLPKGMSGGIVMGIRQCDDALRCQAVGMQYAVKRDGDYLYFYVTPFYTIGRLLDHCGTQRNEHGEPE